jgi:uncharacterized membrane protein YgaE (UPF0421/DUF939 family)
MIWLAYVLLVFNIAFFAGMSALVTLRSRQEARRLKGKNIQVNPKTKHNRSCD